MLYEIYFDSAGTYRMSSKTEMLDYIFQIEESEHFKNSFKFIKQCLKPYLKSLFYLPSSANGISVDVSFVNFEENSKAIDGVYFEGDNVLYNQKGDEYFDPTKDDFLRETNKKELKNEISKAFTTPSFRLKVNYLNLDDDTRILLAPYRLNIKRLAK